MKLAVGCSTHGTTAWNGGVCCAKCERIFTTHDARLTTHAPEVCPCGARLMPGRAVDGTKLKFSARVCCDACVAKRLQADQRKGAVS